MNNFLLIGENEKFYKKLSASLSPQCKLNWAINGRKGLKKLSEEIYLAVITNLKLPDTDGFALLKEIKKIHADLPVIIVSDFNEISLAVEAIKDGAEDYIQKNDDIEIVVKRISSLLQKILSKDNPLFFSKAIESQKSFFCSESMKRVNYEISKVAGQEVDVLILGESGTGKDFTAGEIFRRSSRYKGHFISLPLASLNETLIESELFGCEKGAFTGAEKTKIGKFEAAHNGFIYLPEISRININIQLKLLQFLQYKTITRVGQDGRIKEINLNTRVLMASNDNLEELAVNNSLRWDFYYRINAITINIPPLRERTEDILPMADYFLKRYAAILKTGTEPFFSEELCDILLEYSWPGNIRQLENAIKCALIYCDSEVLTPANFPNIKSRKKQIGPPASYDNFREAELNFRSAFFINLLKKTGGNRTKAAELAGITRQTLLNNLRDLGIK